MNFWKTLGPLTLEMTLSRLSLQLDKKTNREHLYRRSLFQVLISDFDEKSNIVVLVKNLREHLAVERYNFFPKFFVSPNVNAKVDNSVKFSNQDTK